MRVAWHSMVLTSYGVFTRFSKRPANFQRKCIQNTGANAGRLPKVCWKFAGHLLDRVNTPLSIISIQCSSSNRPKARMHLYPCVLAAASAAFVAYFSCVVCVKKYARALSFFACATSNGS